MIYTDYPYSLAGDLLLASPQMQDDVFRESVILMCEHVADGAHGLIINKVMDDLDFEAFLSHLEINNTANFQHLKMHAGGPVDMTRGFILHSSDVMGKASSLIADGIALTTDVDFLQSFETLPRPRNMLVILGYAGWAKGQLEQELRRGDWLHVPANPALVFGKNIKNLWSEAIKSLGIRPECVSRQVGHG